MVDRHYRQRSFHSNPLSLKTMSGRAAVKNMGYADQITTWFDATLAVLAVRLGTAVWTYAHHLAMNAMAVLAQPFGRAGSCCN